jgi:small-conductance mechanosensitive channel
VEGTVVSLGFMRTIIHTGTGEEVSLPNSSIVSSAVRNFSRLVPGSGFVLSSAVTIGYDAPWRQVHAMLLEAAKRTSGILRDPPPYVVQTALSDFYVEYKLVAQAGPEAPRLRVEAMSALHANIQDVFNEHGVQIMSPHYLGDPADAKVVPKERWYEAPAEKPAQRGSA